MDRLTEKDEQGNWYLKGVPWKNLHEGQVITRNLRERLYGALRKLMEYEDTGLTPEEITELKEFYRNPLNTAVPVLTSEEKKGQIVVEKIAVDEAYLYDWYIASVDDSCPVWTEEHISELCRDFVVIPKQLLPVLEQVQGQRWIPVEERLPETDDMVLVTCKTKKGVLSVNRAYYCNGSWHGSGSMSGVIAWMPLPEPYRED